MTSIARNKTGIVFFAVAIILMLRLLFIGAMGIMPQDAYYDFYGEHLALSYYDHPPAIGYLLRLFTEIFGKKVFALKLADSVFCFLTIFFFYKLAVSFVGKHRAQRAVVLLFSTLMVTIVSLISTPDVPLLLFWTISLLCLHRAIFMEKKIYWILSGLFMGLSFDSKYTGIFLPGGLILFLLLSSEYRRLIFSRWLLFCIVIFLITISPVVIWNVQNDFASFKFQSSARVQEGFQFDPLNFIGALGHQSAVLMPILFLAFIYFLFRLLKKYGLKFFNIDVEQLFLLSFFLPLFLGFFALSFLYWVKLNWMMPSYISGIIWISMYIGKKWINVQVVLSLIVHLVLAAEVLFYPVAIKSDDTWFGWKELSEKVKQIQSNYPGTFIFSADDYKTASVLNFYFDDMVYSKNIIGERALQFDFIGSNLKTLAGKNALFIDSDPGLSHDHGNELPHSMPGYFDNIKLVDSILIYKGDQTVRRFFVYLCSNYHPRK
ncbi:MAG: glycosyltransferase family 39 protein [Bacteroidetes bacterium]|nr:glycosyltransferase family 39 protein [Bacteroidota bacterium]